MRPLEAGQYVCMYVCLDEEERIVKKEKERENYTCAFAFFPLDGAAAASPAFADARSDLIYIKRE